MKGMKAFVVVLVVGFPLATAGQNPVPAKLPSPTVNKDSWVMVEIWPEVRDITLAAYFLDFSYEKNRNLCEATKIVFDRDQDARSKSSGKEMSSYRRCMSLHDAIAQSYIRKE